MGTVTELFVNADDYGITESQSKAIFECFEKGYITTTTMCATTDAFEGALKLIKGTPHENKIGVHLNLSEGASLTEGIRNCEKFYANGSFATKYNPNRLLNKIESDLVYKEFSAQVERLLDSGIKIHHLDGHFHIHNRICFFPVVLRIVNKYKIPKVRLFRNVGKIPFHKRIVKACYNSILKINGLALTSYFTGAGDVKYITKSMRNKEIEIMVHPDYYNGDLVDGRACTIVENENKSHNNSTYRGGRLFA